MSTPPAVSSAKARATQDTWPAHQSLSPALVAFGSIQQGRVFVSDCFDVVVYCLLMRVMIVWPYCVVCTALMFNQQLPPVQIVHLTCYKLVMLPHGRFGPLACLGRLIVILTRASTQHHATSWPWPHVMVEPPTNFTSIAVQPAVLHVAACFTQLQPATY